MNFRQSMAGGIIAVFLGTACCWIPALIIGLGGASWLVAYSESFQAYSGIFITIGIALILLGVYQYRIKRKSSTNPWEPILASTITCPLCGHQKTETMSIDSCQYFYSCEHCSEILKPTENDCCVYCSYGTVPCPPVQENKHCC